MPRGSRIAPTLPSAKKKPEQASKKKPVTQAHIRQIGAIVEAIILAMVSPELDELWGRLRGVLDGILEDAQQAKHEGSEP